MCFKLVVYLKYDPHYICFIGHVCVHIKGIQFLLVFCIRLNVLNVDHKTHGSDRIISTALESENHQQNISRMLYRSSVLLNYRMLNKDCYILILEY